MDEVKIGSKLMRSVISKLVKGTIHKKFGYNVDVQINEMNASLTDGKAHVRLSLDAELDSAELIRILKTVGLD